MSNYRPIAVSEPLARLYTGILNHRITQYTEEHQLRTPTQTGFRPHLSINHQSFMSNTSLTNYMLNNLCTFALLTWKAAYDKVEWPLIWQLLQRVGKAKCFGCSSCTH